MNLHQFTIFAAIAKYGNLSKASLELRTSQPAMSYQMKLLREAYGAALYTRTAWGIELTDSGRKLLAGITPILDQVAKLETGVKLSRAQRFTREILRIGGVDSASACLLPAVLAQFKRRRPSVELEFRTRTSEHLERLVLSSVIDLAVTVRAAPAVDLVCEPLRRETVAMFVLRNHPLAKRARLKLSEVLNESLIIRGGRGGSGVTDNALQRLREQGLEIKIGMRCDGPTAIKAAVRQKMGVGIVFEDSIKAEVASGEFKILTVRGLELEGESFIVYSKNKPLSPLAQEFLELLRSECRTQPRVAHTAARKLPATSRREFAAVG